MARRTSFAQLNAASRRVAASAIEDRREWPQFVAVAKLQSMTAASVRFPET